MIGLLMAVGVAIAGFVIARNFVRQRLRFVDGIRSPFAPLVAGVAVALITWPLAILPVITTGLCAVLGVGAGFGTRSGVKALRSGD
jgi:hypothetical protein